MSGETSQYRVNEVRFFSSRATKHAIVDLATVDHLIIYCGAGVTIDRTGLGWQNLIMRVFEDTKKGNEEDPTPEEVSQLALSLRDPQRLASILAYYRVRHEGDLRKMHTWLVPRLQQELYNNSGWEAGLLSRNIIRLAVGAMRVGKAVTIVTTNYDTYLEEDFQKYAKELKKKKAASPGLLVSNLGAKPTTVKVRTLQPTGSLGSIQMVYLHGRVPRDKPATGRLAVSEVEYGEARGSVVTYLENLLSLDRLGLLILGSSITDPPLIDALGLTRGKSPRIALMPMTSTGFANYSADVAKKLVNYAVGRCQLLGLGLIVPDFKFQIAQFCQELLRALEFSRGAASFIQHATAPRYGRRLDGWWDAWHQLAMATDHNKPFEILRDMVTNLCDKYRKDDPSEPELFKLELWVRHDPSKARQLALWASSAGILKDREILRSEGLNLHTTQASVRAFQEGRPQFVDGSELANIEYAGAIASRWLSFLSTPIHVEVPYGRVPAGVVTLASTKDKSSSGIPHGDVNEMEELIEKLIGVGRLILTP